MSTDDMVFYTIAWVVGYACLIGAFYLGAHMWANHKIKSYMDDSDSQRHGENE